jgi:hypothetical protein
MAIDGYPDVCADGTQVVGQWSTTPGPGLVWFDTTSWPSAERALFLRAVSLSGVQVAIYKGADTDVAYLINSAGVEVSLGPTIGNQCVGIRVVGSEVEAVWIESQTLYHSRRFSTALVASEATQDHAVPLSEVGHMGQGFLDLDASGVPIWTDTNRFVTVKGIPLIVPVKRGGFYVGQLGGGFVDQIVAVHGTTGAHGTLYEGLGRFPHAALADGGSGAVLVSFWPLTGGAQFTSIPPLPTFTGFLSSQATQAAGTLAANTNPVPLQHPVVHPERSLEGAPLRMTTSWAAWARGVNRQLRTPINFAAGGTGTVPVGNLGLGTAGPNTVLRGDGTWGPLPGHETLTAVIDGGGSAIGTGVKGHLYVPYPCQIVGVVLMADQVGDVVIDLWKAAFASYPPVVGGSITAAAKPTLSSAAASSDFSLTGWTTVLAAGDVLAVNVDSAATVTRVTCVLVVARL